MDQERSAEYVSVMEVLATSDFPTGVNKSNQTTPPAADADDQ